MESQLSETSLQTVSFSSYLRSVYKSTLFERVGLIRAGVPCGYFYDTAQAMGVSLADLARSLGVPLGYDVNRQLEAIANSGRKSHWATIMYETAYDCI